MQIQKKFLNECSLFFSMMIDDVFKQRKSHYLYSNFVREFKPNAFNDCFSGELYFGLDNYSSNDVVERSSISK